jgi:hypothetical protein
MNVANGGRERRGTEKNSKNISKSSSILTGIRTRSSWIEVRSVCMCACVGVCACTPDYTEVTLTNSNTKH